MTLRQDFFLSFEKNPTILADSDIRKKAPTANHDDRALYRYLQLARNEQPNHFMFALIRKRLEHIGKNWSTSKRQAAHSLAQFLTAIEHQLFQSNSPVPPWYAFLSFYRLNTKEDLSKEKYSYTYFARDVLIQAMAADKEGVAVALMEAYREPALRNFKASYSKSGQSGIEFDDVYQDAFLDFLNKPPAVDRQHTAMLFSIFRTIFSRKCYDANEKGKTINIDNVKPDTSGNNFTEYTDYVINEYQLGERFKADGSAAIVKKAIEQLGKKCQQLLRLRFFRGLKFREIANLTNSSTDAIGQPIQRCLAKLRKVIYGEI